MATLECGNFKWDPCATVREESTVPLGPHYSTVQYSPVMYCGTPGATKVQWWRGENTTPGAALKVLAGHWVQLPEPPVLNVPAVQRQHQKKGEVVQVN